MIHLNTFGVSQPPSPRFIGVTNTELQIPYRYNGVEAMPNMALADQGFTASSNDYSHLNWL